MAKSIFDMLATSDSHDDFLKATQSLARRSLTIELDIQKYLVGVGMSWVQFGDVRPAVKRINLLIANSNDAIRVNAIRSWVEAFFGFEIIEDEGETKGTFKAGKRKAKDLDVAAMSLADNRWTKFTPPPVYKPLSLDSLIAMAVKKAEARVKAGVTDEDAIDTAKLAQLKALIAK